MNKKCVEAVRTDKRGLFVNSWYEELQPSFKKRTGELALVDLAGLSDEGLRGHIASAVNLYAEAGNAHFKLVFAMALPLYRFSSFCESSLGWKRGRILEMLGSARTSEPSRRLEELVKEASGNRKVMSLLETRSEKGVFEDLRTADPGLADALSAYLREYCCLTVGYDVSMPSIDEDPFLIVKLIHEGTRPTMGRSPSGEASRKRHELIEEARTLIDAKGWDEREKFDRLLRDADRVYGAIDDTQFYLMRCRGVVRKGLLEMGRRLAERKVLAMPEDVFFLEIGEAQEAFRGARTGLSELVRERKGRRTWAEAHPGPKSYGKPPGPPPSMKSFPQEVREVTESFLWMFENVGLGPKEKKAGVLSGLGASSGSYTGPVRLVRDESEFRKVRPFDVLVCPTTAPTWTVLFANVGALVTDMGGLLSHPAIIAREYRIPAVLATTNATQMLHDDQIVTVDGDAGTVEVQTPASAGGGMG